MHKDLSNIGTNYTTKRSLCNENELVSYLLKKDYSEVFAEQLSTVDKINMFHRAKHVVGAIGGGICNVLFSPFNTRLIALISPTFLDVNERFLYSFSRVKTHLFMDTHHHELANWKKYMRVRTISGITGEIEEILSDGTINVLFCDGNVSGWNSQMELKRMNVPTSECTKMDEGLNSAWSIDMSSFKRYIDAIT